MKAITQRAEQTGSANYIANISQETEWCDEVVYSRPLDAPDFPPAGSVIHGYGFSLKSSSYGRE